MRQDGDCRGFLEGAVLSVGDGKKEAKARRGLGTRVLGSVRDISELAEGR